MFHNLYSEQSNFLTGRLINNMIIILNDKVFNMRLDDI